MLSGFERGGHFFEAFDEAAARTAKVEAHVLNAVKWDTVGKSNAVVFEEFDRVVELKISDVEPGEISRFHRAEFDLRQLLLNKRRDEFVVISQIREQCLSPWFTVIISSSAAGVAKTIHFGDDATDGCLKLLAQFGIFDDRVGAGEARQVVGLARCHQCDCTRGEAFIESGSEGVLRILVKYEVAVDLVGDQYEIVFFAEFTEAA